MIMYITTYSKIHFTPLEPVECEILAEDIAHAQSMMTRANGHFPEFYSVAQHSIACGREAIARGYADRLVLACLVHDGSEAYLSDITRPVKGVLDGYLAIEKKLQDAIYHRFLGSVLSEEEEAAVSSVDDACLYYEFEHYMGERLLDSPPKVYSEMVFETRDFSAVEQELMEMITLYQKKTAG
ncbi:MAG: phosphohydrolase [Clostridiaceae bacterium]|nr:phosphohydrolase [Clostridiaceae bacterium]